MAQTEIKIFYDAECGFCNRCRNFVERNSNKTIFTFTHTNDTESITVTTPEGEALRKYRACLFIGRRLRQPWKLVAYLGYLVPKMIGDWGYDVVARHRRHL